MAKTARISRPADDLFPLAFRFDDERFGTCVAVRLPDVDAADPGLLLESLHPEERTLGRALRGPRLIEWIGGRHASRLARAGMPGAGSPTLSGLNGAPEVDGVNISISHSERLAAALASPDRGYAIGVDVEAIPSDARGEDLLAERILSPAERDGARYRHGSTSLDQGSRLQGDHWLDGQASAIAGDFRGARRRYGIWHSRAAC